LAGRRMAPANQPREGEKPIAGSGVDYVRDK
jgi:hypothetical protein